MTLSFFNRVIFYFVQKREHCAPPDIFCTVSKGFHGVGTNRVCCANSVQLQALIYKWNLYVIGQINSRRLALLEKVNSQNERVVWEILYMPANIRIVKNINVELPNERDFEIERLVPFDGRP